jgi:protein TonB
MSNLLQASKTFGVAGTALLHLWVIHACVFEAPQSIKKPLPPPEPLRVNLADTSAPVRPPQFVSPIPETKPPIQETTIPDISPPVQKTPLPTESIASSLPDIQSKSDRSADAFPERVSPSATSTTVQRSGESGAQKIEDARQALLSVLIAGLEREKRYPAAARRLGIEGQVMAVVRVDSQGRIISASVVGNESDPMLERATLEALERVQKKWIPMPLPEPMILNIPIRYNLEKNSQ